MKPFKDCHLARMSDGHYCVIRNLGPVKGGKGLKHHEVIVDFTWRALVQFISQRPRRIHVPTTSGRNATQAHLKGDAV
jgi:hypothetical protein